MKKERRDMSDEELDEFFTRKTQNPEIPFQQADWELMKSKLEQPSQGVNGRSRTGGISPWPLLLGLMLLTGGILIWTYWGSPDHLSGEVAHSAPSQKEAPAPLNEGASSQVQENAHASTPSSGGGLLDGFSERKTGETASEKGGGHKGMISGSLDKYKEPAAHTRKMLPKPVHTPALSLASKIPDLETLFVRNLPSSSGKTEKIHLVPGRNGSKSVAFSERTEDKRRTGYKKFSVSLIVAPDVSALRIKDIVGLGNSVGLNLEYFILPHVSLNAGALYAFKTYRAEGGLYAGYLPGQSQVSGDCWMLDLPLNLRYYALNSDLSRWYVSAGTSSYLMVRELYDLEYTSSSGKPYARRLEVNHGKRHYFGIVNLSLGYERVLTEKIAIQVEPYLKLPLQGIGEEGLKLKSAGALIGFKYNW